jgi:hypothetical protein
MATFNKFKSSRIYGEFNLCDLSQNIVVSDANFKSLIDISGNIQNRLNVLDASTNALKIRVDNIDVSLNSIIAVNNTQTTRLDNIDSSLNSIITVNNTQTTRLNNIDTSLNSIIAVNNEQTTRLNNLDISLNSLTQLNVTNRLDNLDASMSSVISVNNTQTTRLNNIDTSLNSIISVNNTQTARLDNIDLSLNSIISVNNTQTIRLNNIDTSLNAIISANNTQTERLNNIDTSLNAIISVNNTQTARLDTIDLSLNTCVKNNAVSQTIAGENLFSGSLLARDLKIVDATNNNLVENSDFLALNGIDQTTTIQSQLNNCAKTNSEYQEIAGENRFTEIVYTKELQIYNGVNLDPIVDNNEFLTLNGINTAQTIQTQLNSKAPINNPTFTGTVSGVTKSMVGLGNVDNLSMVSILRVIYPVGAIFVNYNNTANPNTIFGYNVGTWVQISSGRFLRANNVGGGTGGNSTHNHNVYDFSLVTGDGRKIDTTTTGSGAGYIYDSFGNPTLITTDPLQQNGFTSSEAHLPPYLNVIMWRRTG